jgi:polyphosphate kinase
MPTEYLDKMLKKSKKLTTYQYEIYQEKINELKTYFNLSSYEDLKVKQQIKVTNYFKNLVFPILTPIRFSPYLPFPILPNLSVYLISKFVDERGNIQYSVVTVPKNVERVVHIKKDTYILLEDIIIENISLLYEGIEPVETVPFRITRDFDIEFDDQSDDFAHAVRDELKKRKRGAAIRLEIAKDASDEIIDYLTNKLELTKKFVMKIDGPIDLTYLNELYNVLYPKQSGLVFPTVEPIKHRAFEKSFSIFDVLRKKDVVLFHPHHSYDPVVRMLEEASQDNDVVAIKQTIYRTGEESNILKYLVRAAENGKQVTVLFELKARFDEENNLKWGNVLERAGAHVIYGVPTLKTHSKVLLIVRRTKNLVERFVHLGTGNYNETNAKIYTDISFFTSKQMIGDDATLFFNYISSFSKKPKYKKLIASPDSIRQKLNQMIDQEIENQKQNNNGYMIFKINSVSDIQIIDKLYEASQQGVKIDMIVRGTCCLNPGVEGLSENIHVRSIVGRYLEHMRIFYFHNNGKKDLFISSADLMTRNMENRIELAVKITDTTSKNKIIKMLELQLKDNVKARHNIQGKYEHVPHDNPVVHAQLDLYDILY